MVCVCVRLCVFVRARVGAVGERAVVAPPVRDGPADEAEIRSQCVLDASGRIDARGEGAFNEFGVEGEVPDPGALEEAVECSLRAVVSP